VERAKLVLRIAGICIALIGGMMLPGPRTNPEALTQSLFVWIAMTGFFARPGVILIVVGLGCLVVAWFLPSGRD
jgi:hypothetical protein